MMIDIIIENGFLITMEGKNLGIINNGSIGIKDNKIVVVGKYEEIKSKYKAHRYINTSGKVVMPGFVDAHMHSAIAILKGVANDTDNWLQGAMWPFIKIMNQEESVKGSMVNIVEGLKAGTTTFCDFDYNMNEIVKNHIKIGTRARVAETVNEIHDKMDSFKMGDLYEFNPTVGEEKLQDNIKLFERYHNTENGRITCLLGPQAPDMLSKELLLEIKSLAKKYDTMIYLHVAQGERELNQMQKRYGQRSIPFLNEIDYLNDKLVTVHLYEAKDEEVELVAKKGCSLAICPGSIGLGIVSPLTTFMKFSDKVGLGSDQTPLNNNCNMFSEMKLASQFSRGKLQNPKVMPAWKTLKLATVAAAKAIGLEDEIGSLKTGKKADIIIIDLNQPTLCPFIADPVRNIIPNLVYAARGNEVQTVIIDGKVVMEDWKIKTINEDKVLSDAQRAANELSKRASKKKDRLYKPLLQMQENGYL